MLSENLTSSDIDEKECYVKTYMVKEMIAEKGQTYKKCAAVIHVSPQTFTKKMHGSSMFGIEEANNLGDFLGMTGKEKIDIFLS